MLKPLTRVRLVTTTLLFLLTMSKVPPLGAASPRNWVWQNISPPEGPAPEPRRHGVAIYDPVGKRILVFGGQGESGLLNDLWSYSLGSGNWSSLDPAGTDPSPRRGHNAIYDPAGHRMIVWAGQQGGLFFNDTWALDLSTLAWSEITPEVRPAPRYGAASILDPLGGRLVQFAGFTDAGRFQDIQALDLMTLSWEDLTPPGLLPEIRCLHTAAFDPSGSRMLVYGGQRAGPLDDLWAFDLVENAWSELAPAAGPSGRYFATSFVDQEGAFIVFGGVTSNGSVNETWSYSSQTGEWTELNLNSPPPPRNGMMGVYLSEEDRFIVFGGVGATVYNDLWELSAVPDPTLSFAQFANGAGLVSAIVLINPSPIFQVVGSLHLFDDPGAPLAVAFNGDGPASQIAFSIPPLGSATLSSDGMGDPVSGSIQVSADGPLGGVLRYTLAGQGVAGVGSSLATNGFIAPVRRDESRGLSTGIALAAQSAAVSVSLTLRDQSGDPVDEGQNAIDLPANGHVARFIEELFPGADTAEFEGTLTASSDGGTVAGTAIELGSQPGLFTVLPVTPLE